MASTSLFWFRRDLRLFDNHGLFRALSSGDEVIPVYIFDTADWGSAKFDDQRAAFVADELNKINLQLNEVGSSLLVKTGDALAVITELVHQYSINRVFANSEYEPHKLRRDDSIRKLLSDKSVDFSTYNDHLILKPNEVLKADGTPYHVFTPYSRMWRERYSEQSPESYPSENLLSNFKKQDGGFLQEYPKTPELDNSRIPSKQIKPSTLKEYATTRDQVDNENGTSGLGVHLRYGTVSPRLKFTGASRYSDVFTSELIWREFFASVLFHHPRVVTESFKTDYDRIVWRNDETDFEHWKSGTTGFSIVDAGMHQLNKTGHMHNRVRMIVASFLVKNLLIDWRLGEAYFADKLMDYDLASNNGNWQWAAGTGVDAAPYFRIFNPESQQKKFDPNYNYVRKWAPEYFKNPPRPIVDLKSSRERCLEVYKKALNR